MIRLNDLRENIKKAKTEMDVFKCLRKVVDINLLNDSLVSNYDKYYVFNGVIFEIIKKLSFLKNIDTYEVQNITEECFEKIKRENTNQLYFYESIGIEDFKDVVELYCKTYKYIRDNFSRDDIINSKIRKQIYF